MSSDKRKVEFRLDQLLLKAAERKLLSCHHEGGHAITDDVLKLEKQGFFKRQRRKLGAKRGVTVFLLTLKGQHRIDSLRS